MSELDRIKEQIAYLKYWQGIMVVTDITLVGWLLTAGDSASLLIFSLAIAGVLALTLGIVSLHRQIERRIEDREPLEMETIAGIVMLAVVLVFVGIALDAARRAK